MEVDVNQIIDVLPGLVWTALPNAHVEFLNQRWREYTGMELDEATGVGWQKAIHPDDLPPVLERWGALIDAGVSGEIETRLRRHDGTYRRFLIRTAPLFDATGRIVKWCGVNTEIEDQLAAEEASNARRREAAALRESERNLQLIIDTTPALIWSARPDGITDSVNRHFLDYLGRTWDALRDTGWGTAIHPADQAALFDVWNSLRHSGSAGETEARLQRHDGEYRWFLMRAHPLRDATGRIVKWYGVNVDIEAQKRAEAELERRAALLQQGETVSDTGSFLWRVETDEILWSAQLYRIFDVAPGTTVTLDVIASRVHPDDTRKLRDMTVQARAGRDFEYEHRLLLPDGSVKYLHLVAHATRNARGQLEFIGASQDVTERHLAEQALNKVRSELAHVARMTSLGALTASIAHEVSQPLAGIVTNASTCLRMLAADPPNLDGARTTAQRTLRDGNRASDVIQRLRGLFTRKPQTNERVDLNDAAQEVLALSSGELRSGGVIVRTEFADALPDVFGDRVQLQQVILNLVLNAAEAMRAVDDRARNLLVTTAHIEADSVRLSVRDAGVGIDPTALEDLFEPFFTTKSHGMGVGLSISRSIIESHRGRLSASANDGPGATFWFSVPCTSATRDSSPSRAADDALSTTRDV